MQKRRGGERVFSRDEKFLVVRSALRADLAAKFTTGSAPCQILLDGPGKLL